MPYMRLTYLSDWAGRKDIGVFYPKKAPSAYVDHTPRGEEKYCFSPRPDGGRYQMLWLIHDDGGNYTDWAFRASIEQLCEEKQLFVVMPTVQDFVSGLVELGNFYQMVALEMPEYLNNFFPVSPAGEDNFIAGCGFGGYFAYRIAMNYPHRYAAAASFSGYLDIVSAVRDLHPGQDGFYPEGEMKGTEKDILYMAEKNKREGLSLPMLYQYLGAEDGTENYNRTVCEGFEKLGIAHKYCVLGEGYGWNTWDAACKDFIRSLPLAGRPVFPDPSIVLPKGGKPFYAD